MTCGKSGATGTHDAIEHALEGIQARLWALSLRLRLWLRHLVLEMFNDRPPVYGGKYWFASAETERIEGSACRAKIGREEWQLWCSATERHYSKSLTRAQGESPCTPYLRSLFPSLAYRQLCRCLFKLDRRL